MAEIRLGIPEGTGRLYAGPTLVALGRGYFREQGLDVQVQESGGRRDTIPMLVAGELDVSPQGPSLEFFHTWDPEHPIIMAADHGTMRPGRGSGAIVARPTLVDGGQLRDFADLRGKRIGLSPIKGDHDWLTFSAALRRGGLTFDDVEIVTVDFGSRRHQALADGTVDLSTVGRLESIMKAQKEGIFTLWKHDYEVRPGRQQRTVMFGHQFWTERPDDAQRYIVGYLKGVRDYYDAFEEDTGRAGVVEVLAEHSGYTREAVDKEMVPAGLDPNGYMNVEDIASDLNWLVNEGVLEKPIALDQVVDYRFLTPALAELGKYKRPSERAVR